jgi:plasmid stabilization system protein ParE
MTDRIELVAAAKADIRGQARWVRGNISPTAADKWLDGLYKAIDTLQTRPLRCPVAAESDRFPEELRQAWQAETQAKDGSSGGSARHSHADASRCVIMS